MEFISFDGFQIVLACVLSVGGGLTLFFALQEESAFFVTMGFVCLALGSFGFYTIGFTQGKISLLKQMDSTRGESVVYETKRLACDDELIFTPAQGYFYLESLGKVSVTQEKDRKEKVASGSWARAKNIPVVIKNVEDDCEVNLVTVTVRY